MLKTLRAPLQQAAEKVDLAFEWSTVADSVSHTSWTSRAQSVQWNKP